MSEFKTFEDIFKDYFINCFYVCEGNRSLLKRKLKLSIRTVGNYINQYKLFYVHGASYICEFSVSDIRPMNEILKEHFTKCFFACKGIRVKISAHLGISSKTAGTYAKRYDLIYKQEYKEKCKEKEEGEVFDDLDDIIDTGYKSVTAKQRDDWYNRNKF